MKAIIKERIEQIKQGIIPEGYKKTKIGIIPEEWEIKKIQEIAQLTSSKRVYLSEYVDKGIPFYRGKEITDLKKGNKIEDILYITEKSYNQFKEKYGVPQKGDILITAVGTLGNVYLVPDETPFYFKDGNLIWIKDISEFPKFLEYTLEYNKKIILDSAIGSNQKALTIVSLNKISFNYPSIKEQEKIAFILTKWDSLIEQQEKLVEYKKENKSFLLEKILSRKDSWDKIRIEKLVTESKDPGSTGKDAKKITVKLYGKGVYAKDEKGEGSENTKYFKRRKGQFIYSKLDFLNGAFGIIPEELDGYETTADLPTFDFNLERIEPKFFLEVVSRPAFYKKVGGNAIGSRKAVRVSQSEFLKSYFHLPSIEEQKKLVNLLSKLDEEILLQEEKLNLLKEEKKILMQLLLTGILRI